MTIPYDRFDVRCHGELLAALRTQYTFLENRQGAIIEQPAQYGRANLQVVFEAVRPSNALSHALADVKRITSDPLRNAMIEAAVPDFAQAVKQLIAEQKKLLGPYVIDLSVREAYEIIHRHQYGHSSSPLDFDPFSKTIRKNFIA